MRRVHVLPWDETVAATYGPLQNQNATLAALGMQIAAHALHVKATLVSSDQAFMKITELTIQDWCNVASLQQKTK